MMRNGLYHRRNLLRDTLGGFGALAFAGLSSGTQHFKPLHHSAKAKSIIYLYMEGGPSQVDTFDYKPLLREKAGEPLPFGTPATVFNSSNKVMPSPFAFRRFGKSGSWVSELLPNIASCVDDLTFIHSMHHEASNHSAACYMSHSGDNTAGRPSMGSWITYGLGSQNQDLPGFVVLDCGQAPSGGAFTWSSGFLPSSFSGVKFSKGDVPLEFLQRLDPTVDVQEQKLQAIYKLQRSKALSDEHEDVFRSMIASYESAARMQLAVPDVVNVTGETESTRKLYGMDDPKTELFGSRCLLARRLVERGVRFIEIFSPRVDADRWDQHGNLRQGHINNCVAVDRPIAGLIKDLKLRGLLDETIVLWGGEFGRTPSVQGKNGRDHNPYGYTVFLAGGGFRPGYHHGETDEFGYFARQGKVHLHDLHATLLHQMGIDHERLTYRFGGRDYRLTDVYGNVTRELLV